MPKARGPVTDDLITTREAAELLKLSPNAFYVMRSRGQRGQGPPAPPAYRIGRRLLYSRSEVLAWVGTRRVVS